jgi:Mg-chelatase subunit ChlI
MAARYPRRLRRATAVVLTTLCLVASCASPTPPADAVPELRAMLSQVDRAIVDRRYAQARTLLDGLVDAAIAARGNGELDAEHADRILAAAARLLAALPRAERRAVRELEGQSVPDGGDRGGQLSETRAEGQREEPRAEAGTRDDAADEARGRTTKAEEKKNKRDEKTKKRQKRAQGGKQGLRSP